MREFRPQKDIPPAPFALSLEDENHLDGVLMRALGINAEGLSRLRTRIEKSGDVLRVFVHPWYTAADRPEKSLRTNHPAASRAIERGVLRYIDSALRETTAPLLILEESSSVSGVRAMLPEDATSSGSVVIVPTLPGHGVIDSSFADEALKNTEWYVRMIGGINDRIAAVARRGGMASTRDRMKARDYSVALSEGLIMFLARGLRIKKVLIGGMYLTDTPHGLRDCIGEIIPAFKRCGVGVTLSRYHIDPHGDSVEGMPLKEDVAL